MLSNFEDTPDSFSIDVRHRLWLSNVLASGKYRRVLEIGSFSGYSTQAFLNALDEGKVDEVHLCEPNPKLHLEWRIASCKNKDKVHLHRLKSVQFLDEDVDFDFAFIDGDHSSAVVLAELERLVPAQLPLIAFHDVNTAGLYANCDGPQYAVQAYQKAGYLCLTDNLHRPDEVTQRGLFMAARDLANYHTALGAYIASC